MFRIGSVIEINDDYVVRVMTAKELQPYREQHQKTVFEGDHSIFPYSYYNDEEKDNIRRLSREFLQSRFEINLGVFTKDDEFVGWSYGYQESGIEFYMCNSGILKAHRRKGLYTKMLEVCLDILVDKGFQLIYSRHNATNNSVIIPKLKAGFVISTMEVSDVFGVLIHLKYFTNRIRRKVMNYRVGHCRPDEELKKLFGQ